MYIIETKKMVSEIQTIPCFSRIYLNKFSLSCSPMRNIFRKETNFYVEKFYY